MFVGPTVLSILGTLVIVLAQHVPQIGLAWRPYYPKDIPGSSHGQLSEWASFAVTHFGLVLVYAALLWACLLSDQNGENYFKPEAAWAGLSIAFLMITIGHLVLGLSLGAKPLRQEATQPKYKFLIPAPNYNSKEADDALYFMIKSKINTYMWTLVMPGYVIMGTFNALIHTHTDDNIAVVIFFVILMPMSEYGLIMFRCKLISQYERLDSKCWSAQGLIATILNVCCWFMVCWAISTSQ